MSAHEGAGTNNRVLINRQTWSQSEPKRMRCNFLLSALASLAVMLAKLTITLRQEEITGKDGRTIHEGLVGAKD